MEKEKVINFFEPKIKYYIDKKAKQGSLSDDDIKLFLPLVDIYRNFEVRPTDYFNSFYDNSISPQYIEILKLEFENKMQYLNRYIDIILEALYKQYEFTNEHKNLKNNLIPDDPIFTLDEIKDYLLIPFFRQIDFITSLSVKKLLNDKNRFLYVTYKSQNEQVEHITNGYTHFFNGQSIVCGHFHNEVNNLFNMSSAITIAHELGHAESIRNYDYGIIVNSVLNEVPSHVIELAFMQHYNRLPQVENDVLDCICELDDCIDDFKTISEREDYDTLYKFGTYKYFLGLILGFYMKNVYATDKGKYKYYYNLLIRCLGQDNPFQFLSLIFSEQEFKTFDFLKQEINDNYEKLRKRG